MLASQNSNISGGTFTLVNGDMHYHGPQESPVNVNHLNENPPLSICPFFQDVQLSLLSVGPLVSSPQSSFQVSIGWEGISPGVRICVKKMLVNYNRSCILQIDTRIEMAENSGKGHAFATVLPSGLHEFINFTDQVLSCKEVRLTLLVEGSSSSSNPDPTDFRMEKDIAIEGFDSFRPLIDLYDLDICESNGTDLSAVLNVKIKNPTNIKIEIGAPGLEVEVKFANQKVGYARIEDVCLQRSQVFHRRIQCELEPFLNKGHSNIFIVHCLSDREEIPITLYIPIHFVICGHPVTLDPLVVPVNIKGVDFQLIQGVRSYYPLTRLFASNIFFKFLIKNPISADLQIRSMEFVAYESSLVISGNHKFEDFVIPGKEESWSPKVMIKVSNIGDYSSSGKVDDIFVTSASISIRTPGTNRGVDLENLSFHLRAVPFKAALTL